MNRNIVITVKILQREVGLKDADYRDLLFRIAGVRSSKELEGQAAHRVIEALEDMKPKVEVVKKAPIVIQSMIKPRQPWKYVTATPEQWKNFGTLISAYEEKNITVVALWGADDSKRFKWRYNN